VDCRRQGIETLSGRRIADRPLQSPCLSAASIPGCNFSVGPGTDRIAHPQPLGRTDKYIVMMGSVTGVDTASKQVIVDSDDKIGIRISYDYLILATGATHSLFRA